VNLPDDGHGVLARLGGIPGACALPGRGIGCEVVLGGGLDTDVRQSGAYGRRPFGPVTPSSRPVFPPAASFNFLLAHWVSDSPAALGDSWGSWGPLSRGQASIGFPVHEEEAHLNTALTCVRLRLAVGGLVALQRASIQRWNVTGESSEIGSDAQEDLARRSRWSSSAWTTSGSGGFSRVRAL